MSHIIIRYYLFDWKKTTRHCSSLSVVLEGPVVKGTRLLSEDVETFMSCNLFSFLSSYQQLESKSFLHTWNSFWSYYTKENGHGADRHGMVLNLLYHFQRWNSWTAFLVEVSVHKFESFKTQVFVWFSTLIFPFYKLLLMKRLEFSCFSDFFCKDF
jgi:hypothetical protein